MLLWKAAEVAPLIGKPLLMGIGLLIASPLLVWADEKMRKDFLSCQSQSEAKRLACYDQRVEHYFSHDYEGVGAYKTPLFSREEPFNVEYENNDVIFVLYVYDQSHQLIASYGTGPGKGFLPIEQTGDFYIEIKSTGAWRLWIKPINES